MTKVTAKLGTGEKERSTNCNDVIKMLLSVQGETVRRAMAERRGMTEDQASATG